MPTTDAKSGAVPYVALPNRPGETAKEYKARVSSKTPDRVRCSQCKQPFENPLEHTGCCDNVIDGIPCRGTAERY